MSKNYQDFKKHLFNPKRDKKILFEVLKTEYSFKEQQIVINSLPKTFHTLVFGNCLIRDKNIWNSESKFTEYDFKINFNWYSLQVKQYANEINQFLLLREEFEQKFLLGDYFLSNEALTRVNNTISHCLWSMENEFLQVQFEKGLEFNFKLLNSSNEVNIKNKVYYFLLHFFSFKVEEDISYLNYQTSLKGSYNGVPEHYVNFFNYKLDLKNSSEENLNSLFALYSNYSILDKYLLLRDVIGQLCLKNDNLEQKKYCIEMCHFLKRYIKDPLLLKALIIAENDSDFTDLIDIKKNSIIDLYTQGEYSMVILCSRQYLLEKSNDFSILELFVKSHIHLNVELQNITEKPSFINVVSKSICSYLNKQEDSNATFVDLISQANSISNFDYSQEIIAFLERNMNINYLQNNLKGFLYSKSLNPLHYTIFNDSAERINYLGKNPESVTRDFFMMLTKTINKEKFQNIIPKYRRYYYSAIVSFINGEFEQAKLNLEDILDQTFNISYLHQLVVNCLFQCYVTLDEIDNAIDLYVNTFIINERLVTIINTNQAIEKIIKNRFKNINHNNINLPIFIYHTQSETHTKYIAYDLYMRSIKANKPTELQNLIEHLGKPEILFLKNVATSKIISRKAMVFKNSLQVIKERIEICQILSKLDVDRIDDYSQEIYELTKRLTVQQRIKEIDQSMIYVDETGIIGHELNDIQKGFNRFRTIAQLLKLNKIDATGISYDALLALIIGNIDKDTYKKSLRKTDVHFEQFTQLFVQIRDKFLFSNYYGLDYYLSQRIRHGTIIGQLRKQFQELNLVTSKSSENGDYLPNIFWSDKQLNLDKEVKEIFEKRMSAFSKNIDKLITDLKDSFIQIKTEDAKTVQSGWFDYMYIPNWHRDHLYSLFINKIQFITDFNEFINSIFDILWDYTAQNLQFIRSSIDKEFKISLINLLDDLEADLKIILKNYQPVRIIKNIADCRTNIQSEVDSVIRWFNRSKNDEIDFTLADAFNTSLTIVNNINSPYIILFHESLEDKTLFKGAYFTHFVDLLKIFVTNIFNYFQENNLLKNYAEVNFNIINNVLRVDFSNILASGRDHNSLLLKIDDIKDKLQSANYSRIRVEGKSGFYKANNILKNVFRDETNEILLNIEEDKFNVTILITVEKLLV